MIIILTPETDVADEARRINELMETGDQLLHIRKYGMNDNEIRTYIHNISTEFHKRLVLHSHFHLAAEMKIERLHFNENYRREALYKNYINRYIISTSVHSMEDFNALTPCWDYAFVSPVFSSISKPGYGRGKNMLPCLKDRDNASVKLIGLGGINALNCRRVYEAGAEGIALLGAVWGNAAPRRALLHIMQSLS